MRPVVHANYTETRRFPTSPSSEHVLLPAFRSPGLQTPTLLYVGACLPLSLSFLEPSSSVCEFFRVYFVHGLVIGILEVCLRWPISVFLVRCSSRLLIANPLAGASSLLLFSYEPPLNNSHALLHCCPLSLTPVPNFWNHTYCTIVFHP